MSTTIFSRILRGEISAEVVYDDDRVLAFRDIDPQAPTHVLIIPKMEIPTANDIREGDELLIGHMVRVATQIAEDEGIAEDGYRLVINCNQQGGQAVYHLHLHLLGGRQMNWPPG